jgi:DNA-binding Lrp family transcriptional regulator
MTIFARFLDAIERSQKLKADGLIRRYSYLVDQARAHEEREKFEEASKNAAAVPSQPSFIAELPLYNP